MKTRHLKLLFPLLILFIISGCGIKDKRTVLEIIDPDRHYYPILRGQELDIQYEIQNIGDNPLFINDIHTSCGCIVVDKSSFKVLPKGGRGFIRIKYDSSKNIGYVKQFITIYANLEQTQKQEVTFDVHVVPGALYTRDYEELYTEYKEKRAKERSLVDGEENNLGYYVEDYPW